MADEAAPIDTSQLPEHLRRPPIYDLMMSTDAGQRQVQLITAQAAKGANPGELAQFLELCAMYGLDPMAKEAWCVVSDRGGRRTVMLTVGRDGLRKIAQRQGLRLRGDVVREGDAFKVETHADGSHNISHAYGLPKDRGELAGSWCRVEDQNGVERGFYFAPIDEYRPKNPHPSTPWHNQPSVMAAAASERQALSQATPLSGLLADGEMSRADEQVLVNGAPGGELMPGDGPDVDPFAKDPEPEEADVVPEPSPTIARIQELDDEARTLDEQSDPLGADEARAEADALRDQIAGV